MIEQLQAPVPPALSALIGDSDPAAVRRLETTLRRHRHVSIDGTALDIPAAIEQAARSRPDVVFLDVAMADGAGLHLPRRLAGNAAVVVVTERPDYAVAAFEFGAIDYLLKPVEAARLRETLHRLRQRLAGQPDAQRPDATDRSDGSRQLQIDDLLPLHSHRNQQTHVVRVADVLWVEAVHNYSIVQLQDGSRAKLKQPLSAWDSRLPRGDFVRAGRSHLLQITKLRTIEARSRDDMLVHFTGFAEPLRLGRSAASRLKVFLQSARPR